MAALESRETDLWRVRGVCLEALVGALFHQHGAQLAQLFFRSRPRGRLPDELPHSVQESMGAAAEQTTLQLNNVIAGTASRGAQEGAAAAAQDASAAAPAKSSRTALFLSLRVGTSSSKPDRGSPSIAQRLPSFGLTSSASVHDSDEVSFVLIPCQLTHSD